jgi:hypothetical protein
MTDYMETRYAELAAKRAKKDAVIAKLVRLKTIAETAMLKAIADLEAEKLLTPELASDIERIIRRQTYAYTRTCEVLDQKIECIYVTYD